MLDRSEAQRVLDANKSAYAKTDAYIAWGKTMLPPQSDKEFHGRVKTGNMDVVMANYLKNCR